MSDTLTLDFKPVASEYIRLAVDEGAGGEEVAAFGTRGDGKTWAAFGLMVVHAQRHHALGYPLPTKWLGAADTFASHVAKTHESLMAPGWEGLWSLKDGGHVAVFAVGGVELVHLRLFGVEDQAGMDRLRAESHGLWFEEPAPSSVLVQSSGLSEAAWGLGITSCRLPSYRHPKVMTLNYPDEDHWTWQRFVVQRHPGTSYVRIPPGERAGAHDRAEWERALASRPDMLRRLLQGQPGTLMLGPQVAVGFTRDVHVRPVAPTPGVAVWIGQDGGHTPTSVIAQRHDGYVRVLGALTSQEMGMEQFITHVLDPWLNEHTPWALGRVADDSLLRVVYDPSLDTGAQGDIDVNALRVMRRRLPGRYQPGPMYWDPRKDALLRAINGMVGGQPMLQVDPSCPGLIKALDGAWYYATGHDGQIKRADGKTESVQPRKPNHPHEDYGDAFCYLADGLRLATPERPAGWTPKPAQLAFNPYRYQQPKGRSKTTFNPLTVMR